MHYREIDPLSRVVGILWAAFSLIGVGSGVWVIRDGFSDTQGSDSPKQIFVGSVFVVIFGLSAAFGLALAFERDARRRWLHTRRTGVVPNAKTTIFFLTFVAGGLVLLSGMLVPDGFHRGPASIVLTLCFLAAGMAGLSAIFSKRRKQRERSSKAARKVAEARERRLAATRKRS